MIRFLIINVINNQGQRGSTDIDIGAGRAEGRLWGHMLVVSTPSNICQYPGHCVSDVFPSPSFWIIVSCYCRSGSCRLPAPGAPRSAISDKCYCLWDQGRSGGDFHCLFRVSCLSQTLGQNMKHPLPRSDMAYGIMSIHKKVMFFSFFCLDSTVCFHNIRLAWVDFNVFIIVSVCHNSGTPSYV